MATLRVRFKLNPGRKGIPLSKLSKQAENIETFLRSLASDLGLEDTKNLWLADNFKDGSFISRNELQAVVLVDQAEHWNEALAALTKLDGHVRRLPSLISPATIGRYARLSDALDPGEQIGIGLYDLETAKAKPFKFVDKLRLEAVGRSVEAESKYVGAVMGHTYQWNKGSDKPFLYVREINSSELVKCTYSDEDYDKVANIFSRRTAIVIVEGLVSFNWITQKTEVTRATGFEFAPEFSAADFERFFGAAPGITGELSSEEYVANGRRERQ
ncbi:MAG TPA: hypothetical protein VN629_08885 [Castellaniella sp.]|nr:hypothetical protein [Castellaniella sp.]